MKTFSRGNLTESRVVIYLPREVTEWLRKRAYTQHRSVSDFVRKALLLMKEDWDSIHPTKESERK